MPRTGDSQQARSQPRPRPVVAPSQATPLGTRVALPLPPGATHHRRPTASPRRRLERLPTWWAWAAHSRTVPGRTVHALHPDGEQTMCGQPAGDFVEFGVMFEDATFLRRCRPCRDRAEANRV